MRKWKKVDEKGHSTLFHFFFSPHTQKYPYLCSAIKKFDAIMSVV